MSIREDIISDTRYFKNMVDPYTVNWNGHTYHDADTNNLVNRVIKTELALVEFSIRKIDPFNEDHAGELQELVTYRDYLTGE